MKGILVDINIQGHMDRLVVRMQTEPWKLFWNSLNLRIANVPHMRASRDYAERIIEKLLDSLLRIDSLRGSGRLYLP